MTARATRSQTEARAGVLGWPISHSLSPALHGYWLERLGLPGRYEARAVEPGRFDGAARSLIQDEGWRGFNVTIPHKEAAFRYCPDHDPDARRLGAVNTVVVTEDGTVQGRNTDLHGFRANLESDPEWRHVGRARAVLLGAGGASRAVVAALQDWGFGEITVVNRTVGKAETLLAELGAVNGTAVTWTEAEAALVGADLLINGTSLGMIGQQPLDLSLRSLPRAALVTDLVYAPLETALLAQARQRGNAAVDGLGMLLHQAAPGFQAWFGTPTLPRVDEALRNHVLAVRERLSG